MLNHCSKLLAGASINFTYKINSRIALKIILLFTLINSSIFIAFSPSGFARSFIVLPMNISGILLIVYFFKFLKHKLDIGIYFQLMFFLLIGWSSYTIFRSVSTSPKDVMSLFGHYLMGWAWLSPLAVVFGLKIGNWFHLFDYFGKLLIVGLILALCTFFYSDSVIFGLLEWFAFFPVLLLTFYYQNKRNKIVLLLSSFSFLILTYAVSQRANIVFFVILFVFFIFEFFRQSGRKIYSKIFFLFAMLLIGILSTFQINNYISDLSSNKDLNTDTRTFLFVEMFADMSPKELIRGRGALGTYYSPYFAYTTKHGLWGDSPMRSVNEVGYLEMILKGGCIMVILYLLVLLPAALLGIFKSNNGIARMCGYFILSYLILWLVSYYPVYSAEYILLWMAAGTCMSRNGRKSYDEDLISNNKARLNTTNEE